jgi:hypothetical protein
MRCNIMVSTLVLLSFVAQLSHSAPSVVVTPLGSTPSGNRLWNFQVVPDFLLAPPSGTPLAVELAFAIDHTDLVDVDVNVAVWDNANPGNNPFTNTVTNGLWVDLIGDRTFGAFGSINITEPGPVDLFLIETDDFGLTTLRYGVAASGDPVRGARIAQLDITSPFFSRNFDGHTGTVTVPEPTCLIMSAVGVAAVAVTSRRRGRG